jgi:hypothetical protein
MGLVFGCSSPAKSLSITTRVRQTCTALVTFNEGSFERHGQSPHTLRSKMNSATWLADLGSTSRTRREPTVRTGLKL